MTDMNRDDKNSKVGLVAFNNEVSIIGDGSQDKQVIGGENLDNYDFLVKNGVA